MSNDSPRRICVVGRRDAAADPHVKVLTHTLADAGHDVTVVCGGSGEADLDPRVRLLRVPPATRGLAARALRRLMPKRMRRARRRRAPAALAASLRPDLVYPASARDVDLAVSVGSGDVVRLPDWPTAAPRDLIELAPHRIGWSSADAGPPRAGRHQGTSIALAYRAGATSPGRYLHAALERAGVDVTLLDGMIAWERVPEGAAALIVVESPWPAFPVTGTRRDVPVLFWVHHGEHHLLANLRLVRRYQADAVLLAHSWHLAHRFPVPVRPLPFAVAPETFAPGHPWSERRLDAALIGLGVTEASRRYDTRRRIVDALRDVLGDRGLFTEGIAPEAVAAAYADSRIVLNEGGSRHLPVTMRVFEALGAGALLVTDDLPGTDTLLTPGEHYVVLDKGDVAGQVLGLLDDQTSPGIAATGHRYALDHHTYDHRVDELLRIAAATVGADLHPSIPQDPLAALVDRDVDVDTVALFGDVCLDLLDRIVTRPDVAPTRADAVVVGVGHGPDPEPLVASARRYVYATPPVAGAVGEVVRRLHPASDVHDVGGILRADLGAPGYRVQTR